MRAFWVLLSVMLWLPVGLVADEPVVEVTFDDTSAVPGQALTLRITVLVPTWLPKPVVFPSFEAPNLQVRLPEGSSGPTSRSIEGETWSGVSRRYFITPMAPGQTRITGQELLITWADPGQTTPLETRVALEPIVIEGVIPEAAEGLDPFLAARRLTLSRDMPEISGPLAAEESVSLTVTAEIEGVSAIMLPSLVPEISVQGVALYRDEPVVTDRDNRGVVSGTRSERITLLAESGGGARVPDISLQWYNLESGAVEEAVLDGFQIEVDAPRARGTDIDPRAAAYAAAVAILALGALWLAGRWLAPRLTSRLAEHRQRHRASEPWAYAALTRACKARDMAAFISALDLWAARCPVDPRDIEPLCGALSALGALRYGPEKMEDEAGWTRVAAALAPTRGKLPRTGSTRPDLPPLNPATGRYM